MADLSERRAVISGIGISRIGRRMGIPDLELTKESSAAAISDAGLTVSDIDGATTLGDTPLEDAFRAIGIQPQWRGGDLATGALLSPLFAAAIAVATGRARHVLVYRTVAMLGGSLFSAEGKPPPGMSRSPGQAAEPDRAATEGDTDSALASVMDEMLTLLTFHAYSAVNWIAMHCRRHMHLYGTTKEQLGALAVNSRANAALNPMAAYRDPITLDDYLSARPISDPLSLLDCDVPVDGSVALVISSVDYAPDCPQAVRLEAVGGSTGQGGWDQRADYPKMASVDAAAQMWGRTDLRPIDVDVAELYDGFTFLTLAWLEALGFCADGEGGPFLADPSQISLSGRLPLNTYGGQLSAGRMHGYWVLHEACLQLRGKAGARQVSGAEVAVVAAGGGPFAGCLLLTSS